MFTRSPSYEKKIENLKLFLRDQKIDTAAKIESVWNPDGTVSVYSGRPSRETTTLPPNLSARVERS